MSKNHKENTARALKCYLSQEAFIRSQDINSSCYFSGNGTECWLYIRHALITALSSTFSKENYLWMSNTEPDKMKASSKDLYKEELNPNSKLPVMHYIHTVPASVRGFYNKSWLLGQIWFYSWQVYFKLTFPHISLFLISPICLP